MAESAVSFLLPKLATWIEEEVELLKGVGEEVKDIQSELQIIRAFLKDADAKSESDAGVKEWVNQVRDVAYEIEDVLDGLLPEHHDGESHGRSTGSSKNVFQGMMGFFGCAKFEHKIQSLKVDHNIGTQIKAIKVRIDRISQRKERYNLSSSEHQGSTSNSVILPMVRDPREDALFLEESQIVGIDGPRDTLLTYLLDVDPKLRVVAVYGMGGLGKTTLAKKVYENQRLKDRFHQCRAWITVSQLFDTMNLLRSLAEQLVGRLEGSDRMEDTEMKLKLNGALRGKRYVVVLDDIWSSDAWKSLKNALPDDNCGSRIILTTRSEMIASETGKGGSLLKYLLEPLNFQDSQKLFYMKAFNATVPADLCSKFLKKCNGLPLGIVAIAGLLSTKHPSEWNHVYQSLGALMDGSIDRQLDDLRLVISYSFNDLPYHLKSCFLFMSIFPEDYSIKRTVLLPLWSAEGFLEVDRLNVTHEEIGRLYLDELIQRSLVQVEAINDRMRVKSCKLHDLIREFIIGKASSENFAAYTSEGQQNVLTRSGRPPQRVSVATGELLYENDTSSVHLRSLFHFHVAPETFEKYSRFKLLKILYLDHQIPSNLQCYKLLPEIGTLSNLRYLRLRCALLEDVDCLFEKLVHLETLDLKGGIVRDHLLPGILKMRQLRYLNIGSNSDGPAVVLPTGIHELVKLEKLGVVDLRVENSGSFVSNFGKMTQLRRLAVSGLRQEDEMQFFTSVGKMTSLQTLKVTSTFSKYEFFHSSRLSSPPSSLQKLFMDGALNPLPPWISTLVNLEKLVLRGSQLKDDPMKQLQLLPSLVALILYEAFDGDKLCVPKGGFPRLRKLFLLELVNLQAVEVEQGAMPALESITHSGCRLVNFDELPLKMGHRNTLPEIIYIEHSTDLVRRYIYW